MKRIVNIVLMHLILAGGGWAAPEYCWVDSVTRNQANGPVNLNNPTNTFFAASITLGGVELTSWSTLVAGCLLTNGTVAMAANLPMGANSITNCAGIWQGTPGNWGGMDLVNQIIYGYEGQPAFKCTARELYTSGGFLSLSWDNVLENGTVYFYRWINANANQLKNLSNATDQADAVTLAQLQEGTNALDALIVARGYATNAGTAGAGYYCMSNGEWTVIAPGGGSGDSTNGLWSYVDGTDYVAQATAGIVTNCSQIDGMWCEYLNTTQVLFSTTTGAGSGYCWDKWFEFPGGATSTVSSLAASASASPSINYCYLDYSALPTITVYWQTNEPAQNRTRGGWYNTGTVEDRVLGSVLSTNSFTILPAFSRTRLGAYKIILNVVLAGNPNSTYQATTRNVATVTPVNIKDVHIYFSGGDVGAPVVAAIGITGSGYYYAGNEVVGGQGTVYSVYVGELGPTRVVTWYGEDNDDNVFGVYLTGWTEQR